MDGESHQGKPVVKADKPTAAELDQAEKDAEYARMELENIQLKLTVLQGEHPKSVERFNAAKAALEALQLLAKQ
jgi:hypothetical protein